MAHDRDVAGIRCTEVLAHLSDYVDDELTPDERSRIEAHLAGCDWCETFGGRFATVVGAIRKQLGHLDPIDDDARRRLRERLGLDS